MAPNALYIKGKIKKLNFIKNKTFFFIKGLDKKIKTGRNYL